MRPPCWLMMLRQMASPRPVPPKARESEASPCWNRSKICSSLSAGMPRPWSRTSISASLVVEIARGQMDLAAGRGELDRVREQVVQGLQNAVGVGPNRYAVRGEEDADVRPRRARLLHAGRAAQQIFGAAHGPVQLRLAARDALEIENVVDQAHQPVGVADRNLQHLLCLLRPIHERAAGEQTQCSTQRGQRRAQLMRDRRDKLVLHAVERAALRRVGEGDDDAKWLAALRLRRL